MMMWLVSVIFMIAGAYLFRVGISSLLAPLQKKFLNLPQTVSMPKMLVMTKLCDFSQGSFLQNQYSAVALLNLRSFSRHHGVLLLCLSVVGLWTTMVGLLLTWQVSGEFFKWAGVVIFLGMLLLKKGRAWFQITFGMGIFLDAGMQVLKQQGAVLAFLGESEFHFLLSDGRFSAQLLWMAVAFALTWLIRIESWTAFSALALLGVGSLSLNGAVALVIGEMLAHVWILVFRSRKLNQDTKNLTLGYAVASSVGLIIGFFLAGGLREIFTWGFSFDTNPLTAKSWQFLMLYLAVVAAQGLVVMLWGHFAARKEITEVQKGEYFSIKWLSHGLISNVVAEYILKKINERLDLLVGQKKNLNDGDRAQIPQVFLNDHDREIAMLALWVPLATEATQSRKYF